MQPQPLQSVTDEADTAKSAGESTEDAAKKAGSSTEDAAKKAGDKASDTYQDAKGAVRPADCWNLSSEPWGLRPA